MFIEHPTKIVKGTVQVPSSKSISNRALILQYLFGADEVTISNLSMAKDTELLMQCLDQLAYHKSVLETNSKSSYVIDAWNAGTAFRFLTALLATTPGNWILTGDNRMQERPIKPLVDALLSLGADVSYMSKDGFPPLKIMGKKLEGGDVFMNTQQSSQFVNALLLVAPTFPQGLRIELEANPVSESYIENTLGVLKHFGIECSRNQNIIEVQYTDRIKVGFAVEADWSSIAFFCLVAALADVAEIIIENVSPKSIQGDIIISQIAVQYGVQFSFSDNQLWIIKNKFTSATLTKKKLTLDFRSTPDLTQPVAAMSAGLGIETDFLGIDHLALKETDRLQALENELAKLNVDFKRKNDAYALAVNVPIPTNSGISFQSYNDHRMAMALAPLCLKLGKVEINNPEVVGKSFPTYWDELIKLGFVIS